MRIYLVNGCVDYDGCFPIRAFKLKCKAEKFKKECDLAKKREPKYSSDMEIAEYKEFEKRQESWLATHPAPRSESADEYSISEIYLDT